MPVSVKCKRYHSICVRELLFPAGILFFFPPFFSFFCFCFWFCFCLILCCEINHVWKCDKLVDAKKNSHGNRAITLDEYNSFLPDVVWSKIYHENQDYLQSFIHPLTLVGNKLLTLKTFNSCKENKERLFWGFWMYRTLHHIILENDNTCLHSNTY